MPVEKVAQVHGKKPGRLRLGKGEFGHMSVVLACAGDENFAMPMAVTLFSALVNMEKGVEVFLYILDGGISEINKTRIEQVLQIESVAVSIHWIKPDRQFEGLKTTKALSQAAYMRLALPDVLPDCFGKVLYLDSDLIVETDLMRLWRHEVGGYPLLAVRDYNIPCISSPASGLLSTYELLGLWPDTPYFNSGVMVLNLALIRSKDLIPAILEYLHAYRDTVQYADQDGFNAIIAGDWGHLDPKWNVQVMLMRRFKVAAIRRSKWWSDSPFQDEILDRVKELERNPFILHFADTPKPWRAGLPDVYQLRYCYYLKRSGWFSPSAFAKWLLRWLRDSVPYTWKVSTQAFGIG
jgi:lipopolysaccharide biosynthesis glycosyltransferase